MLQSRCNREAIADTDHKQKECDKPVFLLQICNCNCSSKLALSVADISVVSIWKNTKNGRSNDHRHSKKFENDHRIGGQFRFFLNAHHWKIRHCCLFCSRESLSVPKMSVSAKMTERTKRVTVVHLMPFSEPWDEENEAQTDSGAKRGKWRRETLKCRRAAADPVSNFATRFPLPPPSLHLLGQSTMVLEMRKTDPSTIPRYYLVT